MVIPDQEFWLGVGGIVATAVSFAFYVERKFLPKDEHARICSERNELMEDKLNTIHLDLEQQKKGAWEFQNDIRNSVHSIQMSVAVMRAQLHLRRDNDE